MKKLSILLFLLVIGFTSIEAQTTANTITINSEMVNGNKVPFSIVNQFKVDYPGQQPTWTMDGDNYRANFIDPKQMNGHGVAYDKTGAVIYREEQLAKGDYPAGITNYYNTNFPNEKYEIWSSMDKKGFRSYYTKHNNDVLWFDEKGNYRNTSKSK